MYYEVFHSEREGGRCMRQCCGREGGRWMSKLDLAEAFFPCLWGQSDRETSGAEGDREMCSSLLFCVLRRGAICLLLLLLLLVGVSIFFCRCVGALAGTVVGPEPCCRSYLATLTLDLADAIPYLLLQSADLSPPCVPLVDVPTLIYVWMFSSSTSTSTRWTGRIGERTSASCPTRTTAAARLLR